QYPSGVRTGISSPQVLPPVLPVRNRRGGSGRRLCGAVLLPARLLSAALLRSLGLQRARDVQSAGELRAAADLDGLGRTGATLGAAIAERGGILDRALRAAGRRRLDAVHLGLDPESSDLATTRGPDRKPAGRERLEQRPRSAARGSALSLDRRAG